jgi:hypothetical protein
LWECEVLEILLAALTTESCASHALACLAILSAGDDSIADFLTANGICRLLPAFSNDPHNVLTLLSNFAGATDHCRSRLFEEIPFDSLPLSIPKIRSDPRLSRRFARLLMGLAHGPVPPSSYPRLFACLVDASLGPFAEDSGIALWGIHYLFSESPCMPEGLCLDALPERILRTLRAEASPLALVSVHLLRDLLQIAPELLAQFDWSLLAPQLCSSNRECVRVASLCVRDQIRAHGAVCPELIGDLMELFDKVPFMAKREIAAGFFDFLCGAARLGPLPSGTADLVGLCLGLDDTPLLMAAVHAIERMHDASLADLVESGILTAVCEAVDASGDDFLRSKVQRLCDMSQSDFL